LRLGLMFILTGAYMLTVPYGTFGTGGGGGDGDL